MKAPKNSYKSAPIQLSKAEKILLSMFELSKGTRKPLHFEDIVVYLFKRFPNDFHLKGYPQYPDSGDGVHQPFYSVLKPKGFLTGGNKIFTLTDRGITAGKKLSGLTKGKSTSSKPRLSRDLKKEIERVRNLEGLSFFLRGDIDKILDTDFYNYLGITASTDKHSFEARLNTMENVVNVMKSFNDKGVFDNLLKYHQFLLEKYTDLISEFRKN